MTAAKDCTAAAAVAYGVTGLADPLVFRLPGIDSRKQGQLLHRMLEEGAGKGDLPQANAPVPAAIEGGEGQVLQCRIIVHRSRGHRLAGNVETVGVEQANRHPAAAEMSSAQAIPGLLRQRGQSGTDQWFLVAVRGKSVLVEKWRTWSAGRLYRTGINPAHRLIEEPGPVVAEHTQFLDREHGGLVHPADIDVLQTGQVVLGDAGQQIQRERREEGAFFTAADDILAPRFDQAARHLGHQLVGGHRPDGVKAEVPTQRVAQPPADIRRWPEQPVRAGDIEIEVAGAAGALDQGCVVAGVLQAAGQGLVVLLGPGRQHQGGTAAVARHAEQHALAHPLGVGFVAHVVHYGARRGLGDDQWFDSSGCCRAAAPRRH